MNTIIKNKNISNLSVRERLQVKTRTEVAAIKDVLKSMLGDFIKSGYSRPDTMFKFSDLDAYIRTIRMKSESLVSGVGFKDSPFITNDAELIKRSLIETAVYLNPDVSYDLVMSMIKADETEETEPGVYSYMVGGLCVALVNIDEFDEEIDNSTDIVIIGSKVTYINGNSFGDLEKLKQVVIPEGVTEIGESSFSECSSLMSIVLPDSVTKISNEAFYGCAALRSIKFSDAIKYIGDSAFFGCGLTSVIIPKKLKTINSSVFEQCVDLESVYIHDKLKVIEPAAFRECEGIVTINFPDSITEIGYEAFKSCMNIRNIVLPKGITRVEPETFSGCLLLNTVVFHDNINAISDSAFSECKELREAKFPDSIESIANIAFFGCGFESITLPRKLKTINESVFESCVDLQSVYIHDKLRVIGVAAFRDCDSLTTINIPESVSLIESSAFSGCSMLEKISIPDFDKVVIIDDSFDEDVQCE